MKICLHTPLQLWLHFSKKNNPLLIFTFLNCNSLLNSLVTVTSGCVERKKKNALYQYSAHWLLLCEGIMMLLSYTIVDLRNKARVIVFCCRITSEVEKFWRWGGYSATVLYFYSTTAKKHYNCFPLLRNEIGQIMTSVRLFRVSPS